MHNVGLLGDRHGDLVDPGRPCVVVVVVLVLVVVVVVLWLAVIGGGRRLMCSFYWQILSLLMVAWYVFFIDILVMVAWYVGAW